MEVFLLLLGVTNATSVMFPYHAVLRIGMLVGDVFNYRHADVTDAERKYIVHQNHNQ